MNFFIVTAALLLVVAGNTAAEGEEDSYNVVNYAGPKAFEIGTTAKFGCVFVENTTMEYSGSWQMLNSQQLAKVSERKSFVYTTAPGFIKDRFVLDGSEYETLQAGKLAATINDVRVGDDTEFSCIIEAGETSLGAKFSLDVYSKPEVYVYDELTAFALNKEDVNGTITDIGEVTVASCTAVGVYPKPTSIKFLVNGDKSGSRSVEVPSEEWEETELEDGTLEISVDLKLSPTEKDHKRSYKCEVEMAVDLGDDKMVKSKNSTSPLLITHPVEVVTLSISPKPVDMNKMVTFTCRSDGYPIENIRIIKRLSDGSTTLVGETETDNQAAKLIVTKKALKDMSATYTCLSDGQESKTEKLKVNWHDSVIKVTDINNDNKQVGSRVEFIEPRSIAYNCTQQGNPEPTIYWKDSKGKVISSGPSSAVLKWKNAMQEKSGRYTCSSSTGVSEIPIDLQIDQFCKPKIEKAVSQLEDGTLTLTVQCTTPRGAPICDIQLSTNVAINIEPEEENKNNVKIWSYKGIEPVGTEATFSCYAANRQGDYNVSIVVDDPEIVTFPLKSGGISPGVVVIIILLVTLVVIGIPYAYYRCCRKNDNSGHVKGNQLDSVEVEKLEAVEQTRA